MARSLRCSVDFLLHSRICLVSLVTGLACLLLFSLLYFPMVSHFFFFFPYQTTHVVCSDSLFNPVLEGYWGHLINPYNIMYTNSGYKLLNRKPPFGDRLALFAFLACGECASRSVIPSQIVLSLHFVDAHNPIFGGECLLCKTVHNGCSERIGN